MNWLANKLLAYLARRDPHRALAAGAFFAAHDIVPDYVEDVTDDVGPPTEAEITEVAEELAERMIDDAYRATDEVFQRLAWKVERRLDR